MHIQVFKIFGAVEGCVLTLEDTIPKVVIKPTYLTGGSTFLRLLLVSLHSVCRSGGISNVRLIFILSI